MEIYEYELSDFIDHDLNSDRLILEIKAVPALVDVVFVTRIKTTSHVHVDIGYPTALSGGDKLLLDGVIAAHRDSAHWLPDVKQAKFKAIDAKTDAMVARGFTHQGVVYELYLEAQIRLLSMLVLKDNLPYPILYNSKDDSTVLDLNGPNDVIGLAFAAIGSIKWILDSGTAQKSAVRAATTVEEVNAIVDPRQ